VDGRVEFSGVIIKAIIDYFLKHGNLLMFVIERECVYYDTGT
jgi:hypothetical protein